MLAYIGKSQRRVTLPYTWRRNSAKTHNESSIKSCQSAQALHRRHREVCIHPVPLYMKIVRI